MTGTLDSAVTSLVALVKEQQTTIMELSGRLGFLQAELQQRDEQLKALMAPQDSLATAAYAEEVPDAPQPGRWRRVLRWLGAGA
jgi:uncharacterized coiled-coil protein SlyX